MTDEQPTAPEPVTVLQAALDAVPDERVDAVTRVLARLAVLPLPVLLHVADFGENEARRLAPPEPAPSFPGDRTPPRPYRQPTVEDFVGRSDIVWPRGT